MSHFRRAKEGSMREFVEYLLEFAATGWGPLILVVHAFLESFILPVAHDVVLITVSLARPKWSLVFALMSTIASTAGNVVGYKIGHGGGYSLLRRFIKPTTLALAEHEIKKYDTWAIAIACFTPFPDKVFSPVAGALNIDFKKFVWVIFCSRALRFYLVSFLLFFYGESMREWILDYLGWVMVAILFFMILSAVLWKFFVRYLMAKEQIQ